MNCPFKIGEQVHHPLLGYGTVVFASEGGAYIDCVFGTAPFARRLIHPSVANGVNKHWTDLVLVQTGASQDTVVAQTKLSDSLK